MKRCVSVILLGVLWSAALAGPALAADPAPTPAPSATPVPRSDTFFWMKRGNRWLAASLSLGVNGLGQLYNDDGEKGWGMMSAWLTFPLGYGLDALTGRAYGRLFSYTVNVGVKVWSVVDAWQNAEPAPAATPTPAPPAPTASPAAVPAPLPSH